MLLPFIRAQNGSCYNLYIKKNQTYSSFSTAIVAYDVLECTKLYQTTLSSTPHRMKALQKLLSFSQMHRHYICASFFGTLVSTKFEKVFPDILASSYVFILISIV